MITLRAVIRLHAAVSVLDVKLQLLPCVARILTLSTTVRISFCVASLYMFLQVVFAAARVIALIACEWFVSSVHPYVSPKIPLTLRTE